MERIDVIMPTYNCEKYLEKSLESVYREIPVHHLIIVDGFSKDRTIEIVKRYSNVVIIQTKKSLGKSREIGIKNVDTEWFAFVDSDVVLKRGWFNCTSSLVNTNIGAVEGLDRLVDPRRRAFQEGMEKLRKTLGKTYHPKQSARAFTGDTLIRSNLVKDITIPNYLRVYEDQFIREHIEKQGYKWVKTDEYTCLHYDYKPANRTVLAGEISYRAGYTQLMNQFLNMVKIFPKVLYAFHATRVWEMVPYQISWHFSYLKGSLQGKVKGRFQKTQSDDT